MKPTLLLSLSLLSFLLVSCMGTITHSTDPNTGNKTTDASVAAGGQFGKGKITTTLPNGTVTVQDYVFWNGEKSFKDATSVPISGYRWGAATEISKGTLGTVEKVVTP